MKYAFFLVAFLVFAFNGARAEGEKPDFSLIYAGGPGLSEVASLLVVLPDSASESPLAGIDFALLSEKLNAMLLVPLNPHFSDEALRMEIAALMDSLSLAQWRFLSIGSGALRAQTYISEGVAGVFIAPAALLSFTKCSAAKKVFGVYADENSEDRKSLIDSLAQSGMWALERTMKKSTLRDAELISLFVSADSLEHVLNDSLAHAAMETGLRKPLPEVLRQPASIHLNLLVVKEGVHLFRLLNLSGKVVLQQELFLGKGEHHLIFETKKLDWGVYKLEMGNPGVFYTQKIMIRG